MDNPIPQSPYDANAQALLEALAGRIDNFALAMASVMRLYSKAHGMKWTQAFCMQRGRDLMATILAGDNSDIQFTVAVYVMAPYISGILNKQGNVSTPQDVIDWAKGYGSGDVNTLADDLVQQHKGVS